MTHKHEHETAVCKHDCLHYCPICGKVYCCKCGQEWGESYHTGYYYPYQTYPSYPNYYPYDSPNTTSWDDDSY